MEIKTCRKYLVLAMVLSIFLTNASFVFGMYDAQIGRFTTRDPIIGNPQEPMSLHKYLYCLNDPMNCIDPLGLTSLPEEEAVMGTEDTMEGGGDSMAMSILQRVRNFVQGIDYENKLAELATRSDKALEYAIDKTTEVHHIVGKGWGNLARFGEKISNPENLIRLPKGLHGQITQFFNRGKDFYSFLGKSRTLGEYISKLEFQDQMTFCFTVLDYALENGTMEGFIVIPP